MIDRDAIGYWRGQEKNFFDALMQIEFEEGEKSRPDEPRWAWLVENFETLSHDQERMFAAIIDLPLAQALYVVKVLREHRRPLLEKMALDPRAALCVSRINQAVNRRWLRRSFSERELDLFRSAS